MLWINETTTGFDWVFYTELKQKTQKITKKDAEVDW